MFSRSTAIHLAGKAGILFGALFLVTVLLAAIPAHRPPLSQDQPQQQADSGPSTSAAMADMPGMGSHANNPAEAGAIRDMTPGSHQAHALHMYTTTLRASSPEDVQRAQEILIQLRSGMEKFKDYRVALDEGYKIFMPNVPQSEYHFTKYQNGFLEAFTFDPARPTSLLYKKTASGYDLVGGMYTMPRRASEEQLNARIPLSVASWHLHTNLCLPPREQMRGNDPAHSADWTKFGLQGSIATSEACDAAGGLFRSSIFGWMVRVYPYEDGLDKVFAMHHHM